MTKEQCDADLKYNEERDLIIKKQDFAFHSGLLLLAVSLCLMFVVDIVEASFGWAHISVVVAGLVGAGTFLYSLSIEIPEPIGPHIIEDE